MYQLRKISLVALFTLTLAFYSDSYAQTHSDFDSGFQIGASLNYGGIFFESEFSSLNDLWDFSIGSQFHVLYGFKLSPLFSVQTGANFLVHRYRLGDIRQPETNELGATTGNFIHTSMSNDAGTSYIGVPVNLIVRPLTNKSFYALLGTNVAFKVAHKNAIITTEFQDNINIDTFVMFEEPYNSPELSNDVLLFLNFGVGYSFDSDRFPLNIHIGMAQSVTPYMSADNFVRSWIRNFSLTASYRL